MSDDDRAFLFTLAHANYASYDRNTFALLCIAAGYSNGPSATAAYDAALAAASVSDGREETT